LALKLLLNPLEKIKPTLPIKPNHEQSWGGKPRLHAETLRSMRECLHAGNANNSSKQTHYGVQARVPKRWDSRVAESQGILRPVVYSVTRAIFL
jgi:hypothetical protein